LAGRTLPNPSRKAQGRSFSSPAGSGGLVLALGVCHVPHRTALLSQLVASSARGRDDPGKDARGPAAEGEGASDGGIKAAKGRQRHEGCLQNEWLALGRRTTTGARNDLRDLGAAMQPGREARG